jgi:Rps23 Pro-64 3,4-dihydroxylase Tpa1-like proline 4-hydroxylase
MEPQRTIRPVGERSIQVIDDAFDPAFVTLLDRWLHKLAFVREDYDNDSATAFLHFVHDIVLDKLDSQPLYRQLHSIVQREIQSAYGALSPALYRAQVNLGPYGDHYTAHIDNPQGVTAIYFANGEWRDEWQGETLFYAEGEAVTAVVPRPGRIALLPGDMVHRVGAPSRLFAGARYTIAFKFNTTERPA